MESYYQEHKEERGRYQREYYEEHKEEMKRYRKKRKKERPYKRAGDFLKRALEELGENQSWLAIQLDKTRESVSKYILGVYFLRGIERRKKLCRILRIEYQDLEAILENQDSKS